MTDEKMKEMIEDTYLSYGEDLGLSRKVIEKYYYTNWGRGRIEGITMYEDGTIEVEFEDGWVETDEPRHKCYEHRRRRW